MNQTLLLVALLLTAMVVGGFIQELRRQIRNLKVDLENHRDNLRYLQDRHECLRQTVGDHRRHHSNDLGSEVDGIYYRVQQLENARRT